MNMMRKFNLAAKASAGRKLRHRGITMMEGVLTIAILMSVMAVSVAYLNDERVKQRRLMLSGEQESLLIASRAFLSNEYHALREDLFEEVTSGSGRALKAYSVADLVDRGYLPAGYAENGGIVGNIFGQDIAVLMRAVMMDDTSNPAATLTEADMDTNGNGEIDAILTDGNALNGEVGIEAILVTHGGTQIPRGDGAEAVGMMTSSFGGFVLQTGTTSGPYANYTLDITPFSTLAEYPTQGHFASVLALSSYGVLDTNETMRDAFRRCIEFDENSPEYLACLETNEIHTDIILQPYQDEFGTTVLPALRGLTMLDCRDDGSAPAAANSFTIDCASTNITGDLEVDGSASIGQTTISDTAIGYHGENIVERKTLGGTPQNVMGADRLVVGDLASGQDVSEAIFSSQVVQAGSLVDMPQCPAFALDGTTPLRPRIYLTPQTYQDPHGRPIVGVRAYAEEVTPNTNWRVRLFSFIQQDYCTNDVTSAIQTSDVREIVVPAPTLYDPSAVKRIVYPDPTSGGAQCTTVNPLTGEVSNVRSDSRSDAYELTGNDAYIIVQTRCY